MLSSLLDLSLSAETSCSKLLVRICENCLYFFNYLVVTLFIIQYVVFCTYGKYVPADFFDLIVCILLLAGVFSVT